VMTVGPTSEAELDVLAQEPGRRGEIYAALRRLHAHASEPDLGPRHGDPLR